MPDFLHLQYVTAGRVMQDFGSSAVSVRPDRLHEGPIRVQGPKGFRVQGLEFRV